MRFPFLLLVFHTLSLHVSAVTVKGIVTDANGTPLSYANIYVKGTSDGTSANVKGEYILDLPKGKYEIVYRYMGFQQHVETVDLTADIVLNVTLQVQQFEIRDVVINASDDPANEVIRKAIARRKYFLEAVESYSCDAYVKGMNRLLSTPLWAKSRLAKAGITVGKNGILYLSESVSKLYYKKPGKFHEVIYSSKVSGNPRGFTFNSAQNFFFNFYERNISIPVIAARPFVSPLSDNAFYYYKFKMLGAYKEGDLLINKIQVIPKRKSDPCFTGVLSIVENNWNIHSLELYLVKDNGIEYVDSLKITQYFIPVKDDLWLASQQRYDAVASFLGLKGDGYYLGVFKNYQLNNNFGTTITVKTDTAKQTKKKTEKQIAKEEKKLEKKIFTPEVIKIEDEANKRDTAYWENIRPVPLTELEIADYTIKDSIQVIKDSPAYKDSMDKISNKPTFLSILTGHTVRKQTKRLSVQMPSLLGIVNYNTLEGLNFQLKFNITKFFERDRRRLSVEPVFRYGVVNKSFNAMATISYRNSQISEEYITLSGGKLISQFNETQPQPYFGNTWKTLVLKLNHLKLFEQYFVRVAYSRELYNGIFGALSLQYAQRFPMENMSRAYIFKSVKRDFTPNGVDIPGVTEETDNITRHNSFRADLRFTFRFGQKYITRPDVRFRTGSKFPELTLLYRHSFRIKGFSDLNFNFVEARLAGDVSFKMGGTLHYRMAGGGFPYVKRIQYPDYRHFYGNFLNQGETDLLGFFTLQYYRHSTNRYFAEAHLEHHFGGILLGRIPGINKLKLYEVLGFHFLYTPVRQQYFQLDVGLENIFKLLRVDFVTGFGSKPNEYYIGARLGLAISIER
ncbi:MAG: carboxypeptidase-like regulatory domain-containing protein [Chitinophagales bacterium]|nr:carboxypeptidase-like regulatory domain-containing protein [Chitinophagales bacterium]